MANLFKAVPLVVLASGGIASNLLAQDEPVSDWYRDAVELSVSYGTECPPQPPVPTFYSTGLSEKIKHLAKKCPPPKPRPRVPVFSLDPEATRKSYEAFRMDLDTWRMIASSATNPAEEQAKIQETYLNGIEAYKLGIEAYRDQLQVRSDNFRAQTGEVRHDQ